MNTPLVSIIIPSYNRPHLLQRAIKSVLKQTYSNLEIIVIDDNSDKDLFCIIDQFKDERIIYYRNKENKGAPYSRNRGIGVSKGNYINLLDDDDILLPQKIEVQLEKFQKSHIENLGVVVCDVEYRRKDINEIKQNHCKGNIYEKLLRSYAIYGIHSMLIKRKYIVSFDTNLKSNQEYDLTIRLAKRCNFDFVPQTLARVFYSSNQISFNFPKKIKGTKYLFNKYRREFLNYGITFYIYNWLRFKFLLIKYYFFLFFGESQVEGVINEIHKILLNIFS
ncbi:MAG: glycosyltransferase [Candidatus Lokiarchaeota archaeon]|nr:glycosyltransferase [Candidatus Lokiarchaeota archaeon]